MADERDALASEVEGRIQAEFGCAERDAELVAGRAVRALRSEGLDWNPAFVVAKMGDAPKGHSVPEKWNWLVAYLGGYLDDPDEYALDR